MKMEQAGYSEMSAYKIQTPGNHQKESIQHTEHGESLKSRQILWFGELPYTCVRVKTPVFSFTPHTRFIKRYFVIFKARRGRARRTFPKMNGLTQEESSWRNMVNINT